MLNSEEKDIIIDFALQNEDNFKIAINIGLSFDKIRKIVILDFLDSLEKALKNSLNGEWTVENEIKENVFQHWRGLYIYKNSWNKKYKIGFESQSHNAKGFIIGIVKDETIPTIEGLKEQLDDKYRKGLVSAYWSWYQYLDYPYQNWDNEEVLMKMKLYTSESVEYFKNNIFQIKDIATQSIDSQVL